jgi:DNA polymerase-3 subunit alpha
MGITDLDPLPHGLIFERFLNPERISMPDIDIDFDERRRGEVIRYVTEKYGEDRVAQIATYGTIKAKAAIKDSGPGARLPVRDRRPDHQGDAAGRDGQGHPALGHLRPEHPRYKRGRRVPRAVRDRPRRQEGRRHRARLEGLIRQWGVHAAGVIMSSEPLIDVIPLMRRDADGAIITQFDYPTCETLGLLKMDFLGLRNLTIIDDAVKNIEPTARHRPRPAEDLPLDDPPRPTSCSARGDTLGVFQLDGGPMRALLRLMKPDNFEDISAVGRSTGPARWAPTRTPTTRCARTAAGDHPDPPGAGGAARGDPRRHLRPDRLPGAGHGAAQKVAGYTLGQADLLRRAMGKKKKEILDKEFVPFRDGMRSNGYSDEAIKALWDVLVPFADYAFNKAHTAAYGLVSYWTAYLKANYPAEYMAALLTSVGDDKDKMAIYLASAGGWASRCCRPTSTSRPALHPGRQGHPLRPGRGPQRRRNVVERSSGAARRRAPYRTSTTSCQGRRGRLQQEDHRVADQGRRVRLDGAHPQGPARHARRGHRRVRRRQAQRGHRPVRPVRRRSATTTTRRAGGDVTDADRSRQIEWDKRDKLAFEREMLGLYVSDHPLFGLEHVLLHKAADTAIAALSEEGAVADGAGRHAGRHPHRRAAPDHQAGQTGLGLGHPGGPRPGPLRAISPGVTWVARCSACDSIEEDFASSAPRSAWDAWCCWRLCFLFLAMVICLLRGI